MESLFRKFRSKHGEVWQLGCYEAPYWSDPEEDGGRPFRPRMAVFRSVRTGRFQASSSVPGEPGPEELREVVSEAARAWRLRPERIEVADARLAEELGGFLSAERVAVEVRDDLPELRAALEKRTRDFLDAGPPAALSAPGVTVERMAAFARAAARFAEAAPWRRLDPADVLILESAALPEELRRARVLAPPIGGVLFHPEEPEEDFEASDGWGDADDGEGWEEDDWEEEPWEDDEAAPVGGLWRVTFGPPVMMPPDDVELWIRHDLPLAHSKAYPVALCSRPEGFERPEARRLSWFEAVLAALAETTEEEMDAGRWDKEVVTAEGPVRLDLSLPNVLEPSFAERRTIDGEEPSTPEELAESLAREAQEALGRRQIHLARRAVALWPGCVDAWLMLARRAPDGETARDLYAQAVAAAERLLPRTLPRRDWFLQLEERYGVITYVFARTGLARALWVLGAREEATGHFQGILAVDPDDSERVRYLLAHALLALGRADEAEGLLARYAEDRADWHFTRALLAFHHEGASPVARRELAAALRSGRHLAKQLLSARPADPVGPRGRQDVTDAALFRDVWMETPGALEWLRSQSAAAATAAQARKKKRKEKKGKKRRRRRICLPP